MESNPQETNTCEGQSVGLIGPAMGVALLGMVVISAVEGAWFPDVVVLLVLAGALFFYGSVVASRVTCRGDSEVVFTTLYGERVVPIENVVAIYRTFGLWVRWSFEGRMVSISICVYSMNSMRSLARRLIGINPYIDARLGRDTV